MQSATPSRALAAARAQPPLFSALAAGVSFLLLTSACTTVAPPSVTNHVSLPVLSA